MEVSMSITRRGKYTNSNICINVQVRTVVCLFFLLYANLLVLVTLCEGNHYPFIEERYDFSSVLYYSITSAKCSFFPIPIICSCFYGIIMTLEAPTASISARENTIHQKTPKISNSLLIHCFSVFSCAILSCLHIFTLVKMLTITLHLHKGKIKGDTPSDL